MTVSECIEWKPSQNVLAWKYPFQEFFEWTRLIVSEYQEAYLVKEGKISIPFGEGCHVLNTGNYPFLISFLKLSFGEVSPFKAEIWFIQRNIGLNMKWGTLVPVPIEDPVFHLVLPIRAFGQYEIQVEDNSLFLIRLAGTLPAFTVKTLTNYSKSIVDAVIKTVIAQYLLQRKISVLRIASCAESLSKEMEETLKQKFRYYGIRVCNFHINSISADPADSSVVRLRQVLLERAANEYSGEYLQPKSPLKNKSCLSCGSSNKKEASFCEYCGSVLQ